MQSKFQYLFERSVGLFVIAIAFMLALQENMVLIFPLSDAFHQGEFFAAAMAVLRQPPFEGDPYTLHGAVDLVPALMVSALVPSSQVISYTAIIYPLMSMLSALIVVLSGLRIAKWFSVPTLVLVPLCALLPFCVGWRDLFFALSLYLFSGLIFAKNRGALLIFVHVLFGVVIAVGVFWSYNRGAAALIAFGPVLLWLSLQDRRYLVSIISVLWTFPIVGWLLPGVSVAGYVDNFQMLLETSPQWRYEPSARGKLWTISVLTGFGAATFVVVRSLRNVRMDREAAALIVALLIAAAVYLKIGLGRIDKIHVVMACWLPLFIVSVFTPWGTLRTPKAWWIRGLMLVFVLGAATTPAAAKTMNTHFPILLVTLLFAMGPIQTYAIRLGSMLAITIVVLAVIIPSPDRILKNIERGKADWLAAPHNLPANADAVTELVLWSAQEIAQSDARCVFDLSNMGLVNAVAGLPSCSRFTYPVYANALFEEELISDLRAASPLVVLYRSEFWSYAIDDRPMSVRFPRLDAAIRATYPHEVCKSGACLRYKD